MKRLNGFIGVAAAALFVASTGQGWAQSKPSWDDGIAASPKVRQMLNERRGINQNNGMAMGAACCATTPTMTYKATGTEFTAASPRVRQMQADRLASRPAMVVNPESVGYKPTGADGITASPKVRAQLDERNAAVQIAPLK